jgi:large subunit ribosomal protein L18
VIRIKLKSKTSHKVTKRLKSKARIRKKIDGDPDRPRMAVFRSGKHIYVQVIDDSTGRTLVSYSSLEGEMKNKNISTSKQVGQEIAKRALSKNIKTVVFDRSGYVFHGRIKAVADGAREAGLSF